MEDEHETCPSCSDSARESAGTQPRRTAHAVAHDAPSTGDVIAVTPVEALRNHHFTREVLDAARNLVRAAPVQTGTRQPRLHRTDFADAGSDVPLIRGRPPLGDNLLDESSETPAHPEVSHAIREGLSGPHYVGKSTILAGPLAGKTIGGIGLFQAGDDKQKKKCCPEVIVCNVNYKYWEGDFPDYPTIGEGVKTIKEGGKDVTKTRKIRVKYAEMDIYARWTKSLDPCDCACCVPRQYIKGYRETTEGEAITDAFKWEALYPVDWIIDKDGNAVPSSYIRKNTWKEDGQLLVGEDGKPVVVRVGHKKKEAAGSESYGDCWYKWRDTIMLADVQVWNEESNAWTWTTDAVGNGLHFEFKIAIEPVDTCEGTTLEKLVLVEWKHGMDNWKKGTEKELKFPPGGPAKDWPSEDDIKNATKSAKDKCK